MIVVDGDPLLSGSLPLFGYARRMSGWPLRVVVQSVAVVAPLGRTDTEITSAGTEGFDSLLGLIGSCERRRRCRRTGRRGSARRNLPNESKAPTGSVLSVQPS